MGSCNTTWDTVASVETTWGIVPDQTLVYDQIEGSPIGLLIALTYSSTVTHYIGPESTTWEDVATGTTNWEDINCT